MQDRYVGDIGDFVKFAILRALTTDKKLAVAWWLYPNEYHNADGRHITYLSRPDLWRNHDPFLFDQLGKVVDRGDRTVAALQDAQLIPNASFADEPIPTLGTPAQRRIARADWLVRVKRLAAGADVLFADPDNGLETKGFNPGASKAGKSISLLELSELSSVVPSLIIYHHQTRMAGGHLFELAHWGERLRKEGFKTVDVLRAAAFSARAFFLLDATEEMRESASRMANAWGGKSLTWHPNVGA